MKKGKLFQFVATALALAFAGCSDDTLTGDDPEGDQNGSKDAVYMNVTVQLPVAGGMGSRSTTGETGGSSDGTEIGLDRENKVNSVLLVLADTDNKFIGCAEKSEGITTGDDGKTTTVQSISKSVLSEYYNKNGANGTLSATKQQINVFIFCNPTDALRRIFDGVSAGDETWYDQVCIVSEVPGQSSDNAAIWGGADYTAGFLMSSYKLSTKKIPAKFSDWDEFTTKEKPFKLSGNNPNIGGSTDAGIDNSIDGGAIEVERSVARFDFKDGSKGNNTYDVVKDQEDDTKYIMQIQLQRMALVNMSKNFYYLRRVSNDGLGKNEANTNGYGLCGLETSNNYVVDTDAKEKNDGTIISGNKYSEYFNFCLGHTPKDGEWTIDPIARDQWYTSKIQDVIDSKDVDNDTPWNEGGTKGDYKIWRYVTENTIPGATSNQMTGISTGIVFKGKMIVPAGVTGTLADALQNATGVAADDPILYVYGNGNDVYGRNIFVRWTEVRAMAIEQGTSSPMYKAVFGNATNTPAVGKAAEGEIPEVPAVYSNDAESADAKWDAWYNNGKAVAALKAFKLAATEANFTLYESSVDEDYGKGYYCYYYYWNRHNDNSNAGVMRSMEFAVVRNNVYKLAVTNISKLGHPRVSENDPDPVDPEDPDEDGDVYLSVSVEVLPWVVRVNNIEF